MTLNPNYIIDEKNNKIGVMLDINTYEKLLNIVEDKLFINIMEKQKSDTLSRDEALEFYKSLKNENWVWKKIFKRTF